VLINIYKPISSKQSLPYIFSMRSYQCHRAYKTEDQFDAYFLSVFKASVLDKSIYFFNTACHLENPP